MTKTEYLAEKEAIERQRQIKYDRMKVETERQKSFVYYYSKETGEYKGGVPAASKEVRSEKSYMNGLFNRLSHTKFETIAEITEAKDLIEKLINRLIDWGAIDPDKVKKENHVRVIRANNTQVKPVDLVAVQAFILEMKDKTGPYWSKIKRLYAEFILSSFEIISNTSIQKTSIQETRAAHNDLIALYKTFALYAFAEVAPEHIMDNMTDDQVKKLSSIIVERVNSWKSLSLEAQNEAARPKKNSSEKSRFELNVEASLHKSPQQVQAEKTAARAAVELAAAKAAAAKAASKLAEEQAAETARKLVIQKQIREAQEAEERSLSKSRQQTQEVREFLRLSKLQTSAETQKLEKSQQQATAANEMLKSSKEEIQTAKNNLQISKTNAAAKQQELNASTAALDKARADLDASQENVKIKTDKIDEVSIFAANLTVQIAEISLKAKESEAQLLVSQEATLAAKEDLQNSKEATDLANLKLHESKINTKKLEDSLKKIKAAAAVAAAAAKLELQAHTSQAAAAAASATAAAANNLGESQKEKTKLNDALLEAQRKTLEAEEELRLSKIKTEDAKKNLDKSQKDTQQARKDFDESSQQLKTAKSELTELRQQAQTAELALKQAHHQAKLAASAVAEELQQSRQKALESAAELQESRLRDRASRTALEEAHQQTREARTALRKLQEQTRAAKAAALEKPPPKKCATPVLTTVQVRRPFPPALTTEDCDLLLDDVFEKLVKNVGERKSIGESLPFKVTYQKSIKIFKIISKNTPSIARIDLKPLVCTLTSLPEILSLYILAQLLKLAQAESEKLVFDEVFKESVTNIKEKMEMMQFYTITSTSTNTLTNTPIDMQTMPEKISTNTPRNTTANTPRNTTSNTTQSQSPANTPITKQSTGNTQNTKQLTANTKNTQPPIIHIQSPATTQPPIQSPGNASTNNTNLLANTSRDLQ